MRVHLLSSDSLRTLLSSDSYSLLCFSSVQIVGNTSRLLINHAVRFFHIYCGLFIFTVNIWFFVVVSSTFHSLPHTIQKSSGHVIYVRGWNEFWPHLQAIDRCPFQAFLRMLLKSHERVAEKMASSKAGHTGMIFAHKIQPQEMRPQSWRIWPYDGCISLMGTL